MYSWTQSWSPAPTPTSISFWDKIQLYNNPSLWWNLHCNGDGSWIWEGLCMGSLIITYDRSYMWEVLPHICSAAVMSVCTVSGSLCKCTIAEKSPASGSYRGELLGAILAQLILHAAVQGRMGPYPVILEDCNNLGMVRHGNKPHRPLSMTQTHADVWWVLKQYIVCQPFALKFLYVASHADDTKSW